MGNGNYVTSAAGANAANVDAMYSLLRRITTNLHHTMLHYTLFYSGILFAYIVCVTVPYLLLTYGGNTENIILGIGSLSF